MPDYAQLAVAIVSRQEMLIGSIAWEQAAQVKGLQVQDKLITVVSYEPKQAIDELVERFSNIFGPAAVEVSKDAVSNLVPQYTPDQLPDVLK